MIVHQFSFHSDNRKIKGDTKLAFLRKIFDRRTQEYYAGSSQPIWRKCILNQ
ncbi:MAG: hypothetical protein M1556_02630 [Candidatus Thermoplasmatota archaeon]|nr:hypothetical protein [Candidatus Thermoplasmatota archaeon]